MPQKSHYEETEMHTFFATSSRAKALQLAEEVYWKGIAAEGVMEQYTEYFLLEEVPGESEFQITQATERAAKLEHLIQHATEMEDGTLQYCSESGRVHTRAAGTHESYIRELADCRALIEAGTYPTKYLRTEDTPTFLKFWAHFVDQRVDGELTFA